MSVGAAERTPRGTVTDAVLCTGLTYRFGTHTAVDHVDMTIEPGEMFGLLGPNISPCLLYTSPSPRDGLLSRMPSSA